MREAHGGGPTLTAGAQCTQATQPARRGSIRALQSPPTPPLPTNRWHSPGGCTDAAPGGVTDSGHGATSPAPITTWRSLALAAALRHAVTSDPAGAKLLCGTGSLLCLHPRGGHTWSSLQPLSVCGVLSSFPLLWPHLLLVCGVHVFEEFINLGLKEDLASSLLTWHSELTAVV